MADALIEWVHERIAVQLGREQDALEHTLQAGLILGRGVRVDVGADGCIDRITITDEVPSGNLHWYRPDTPL